MQIDGHITPNNIVGLATAQHLKEWLAKNLEHQLKEEGAQVANM